MKRNLVILALLIFTSYACNSSAPSASTSTASLEPSFTPHEPTNASSVTPSPQVTATESFTETPSPTETWTPLPSDTHLPVVESLEATVTADRLSCRYGPGPEYLYLFAFRSGARINLIGRVDAENWGWAWVENEVPCWVRASYLNVEGDILSLPVVYPGIAKLPITPYYPGSEVLSAERNDLTHEISLSWVEVPVSLGDYEDDSMQTYIIELWRCESGELIFDPLATRLTYINFVDEPGCSEPSHGQVWVQEKHGYAGPAEIPWPEP